MIAYKQNSTETHQPKSSGLRKAIGCLTLFAYTAFLLYRAWCYRQGTGIIPLPLWHLQNTQHLITWVGQFVFIGLGEFICYIPLGFITIMMAVWTGGARARWIVRVLAHLLAVLLTVLVRIVQIGPAWHVATLAGLVLPLLGCLLGLWLGSHWFRGWRARLWLVPKLVLLACLLLAGVAVMLRIVVAQAPLPFEAAQVTSEEKRRLVHLIRSKSPRSLEENQTHTLILKEQDINVLLAWGLSLGSGQRKAQINLDPNSASLAASLHLPLKQGVSTYLNMELTGQARLDRNFLNLTLTQCRIGSVALPHWLLEGVSPMVTSLLNHSRLSKPFVDAVYDLSLQPDTLEVTYGRLHLPEQGFREDIFGAETAGEEVQAATRVQIQHLLALAAPDANRPCDFGTCLEAAFNLAQARSIAGNPIIENRAAIFALGIGLGHWRVEQFLGNVHDGPLDYATRQRLARVTLRRRTDWTKHFWVSAALTLFSEDIVSYAVGLLKEELDAGRGGSGFSFADLLADRTGTMFALCATRDENAARAMQDLIVRGFRVNAFFPEAADLPEGLSDAQFQSRYGGVDGDGYNELLQEIDRRIAACAAYRH
ncbi:MAG: hypothetical protein GY832_07610 [Chloroflexi bacterium]|nr:hypothetical protein [Chloroflexota bacterium]